MVTRKKANKDETLDLSNRVFPYPHDFYQAFPKLSCGTIKYSQTGSRGMLSYPSRAHHEYLHTSTLAEVFPIIRCQSPVCRGGGFELYGKIALMLGDSVTEAEYEISCAGFTGKLRRFKTQPCGNTLRCHISLEYKPEGARQDAS